MATTTRIGREEAPAVSRATARGDGKGRRRREEAQGGGAGEADLRRGGELQHGRRRNRANARAPQKIYSAAAGTAPAGGPISSPHAVYWRFFYRIHVIARLLKMLCSKKLQYR
jgi:hypothetical protein